MTISDSSFSLAKLITKTIWYSFFAGITALILLFLSVIFNSFGLWGEIPDFAELENPNTAKASIIYAQNGEILGKYYSEANRVRVPFNQISPNVIMSLIATEDERFEEHAGIDGRSLLRVAKGIIQGLIGGEFDGGGSTITQQLAKNLFRIRTSDKYTGSIQSGILRKIGYKLKEWITSIRLEEAYTKEEIITMYLNTVDHGVRAKGIHSAAKIYFNKKPIDLNLQEAAVLVGTYKANYTYDPVSNPENSKTRRSQVLGQLVRSGFISQQQKDSLSQLPLALKHTPDSYNDGIATYFRTAIRKQINQAIGKEYDLTNDGLKIYTTLDYNLQLTAENALLNAMEKNQKRFLKEWNGSDPWDNDFLVQQIKLTPEYAELSNKYTDEKTLWNELRKPQHHTIFTYQGEVDTLISLVNKVRHNLRMLRGSMLAIDKSTGFIKAYVGGVSKKHFDYDMVSQGARQVGSTFKPLLYSLAVSNGYHPCSEFLNVKKTIRLENGTVWEPKVKPDGGPIKLKTALKKSLNNIAAQLVELLGPERVVDYASNFGIDTKNITPNLSIVLGTSAIPMDQIIRPYQTIANLGEYVEPVSVIRIENSKGKVIYEYTENKNRVMTPTDAYKMAYMMTGVTKDGTGSRINTQYKLLTDGNEIGGKTGTTQNSKDCWFIGFTKDLAIATWVGPVNNNINYKNTRSWYGGNTALPIFGQFLKTAYKKGDLTKGPLNAPETLTEEMIREQFLCSPDTLITSSSGNEELDLLDVE